MRGSIDGMGTATPIGTMLPAVYAEDELAQRFTAGLDEVFAPILNTLDCLDAYFRPSLAPMDFAAWLGGWVGAETDRYTADGETDTAAAEERLRESVSTAMGLHRLRGTRRGLAETVRLVFGVEPLITESGAAAWDARPLGRIPGDPVPALHVSISIPDPGPSDEARLDDLVAAARPAHMPYTVQVTASERTTDR